MSFVEEKKSDKLLTVNRDHERYKGLEISKYTTKVLFEFIFMMAGHSIYMYAVYTRAC